MALTIPRRQRVERALVLSLVGQDWWQLRRAAEAKRPEAVLWRLQRVQQSKGMHQLTLPEMLVASGSVR